ncbi:putative ditrans,polycis-polyprenyl diphosphate synthase [(2E,6E)-farnesyldiphosphate specific] [Seiridium cardinale]|uniref:ditrans,polycis-polyprenyl diphosphate synthase [(2E,6E)-farnesyldiphosphate specific] n=1 Tax=Seiridium cardinale TaxID=138064 RepID=A0ABR2XC96_9PEZI
MPFSAKDTARYREDVSTGGQSLKAKEREQLLKPYLPPPPENALKTKGSKDKSQSRQKPVEVSHFGVRKFLRQQLYTCTYALIHIIFSFYIRLRIAYHAVTLHAVSVLRYHHRTPEYIARDVHTLKKKPRHVSVILKMEEGGKRGDAKDKLLNDVADITAWCASAGIPVLTVYEKTGILKEKMEREHREISRRLQDWFGKYQAPILHIRSPNMPSITPPNYHSNAKGGFVNVEGTVSNMGVNFISAEDGRDSMVDLTRVLTDMSQRGKLLPEQVTMDIVDQELRQVLQEPDLLISFAPWVDLQAYPPWQIRLTEIYCEPDNQGVGYQVFLNALRRYSSATFKLGK